MRGDLKSEWKRIGTELFPDWDAIKEDPRYDGSKESVLQFVKKDVYEILETLPDYKQVSKIVLRKEAFIKTTTNKIKRGAV